LQTILSKIHICTPTPLQIPPAETYTEPYTNNYILGFFLIHLCILFEEGIGGGEEICGNE
jgi:hypothetical protein